MTHTLDIYKKPLQNYYDDYVANVSRSDMAISLETATFLNFVVSTRKPSSILDLGSGFSSFVFRKFSDPQCEIYSIDDSQEWLDKSKDFLIRNNTRHNNMQTWDVFLNDFKRHNPDFKFDLVFHDLGGMKTRQRTLNDILSFSSESGVIIFDDIHKSDYYKAVYALSIENNFYFEPMKSLTLDSYGRYVGIGYKKSN